MHALAPLLFILILFNSNQLKVDKLYRANVFALVGTSYFVLLQYTVYWYRIFPSQSLIQYLPGLLVVLSTIGIALSPWNKRSHPLKTLMLCSLFAIALACTLFFDKNLKESLADIGGFFHSDVSLKPSEKTVFATEMIELSTIGVRLRIPQYWLKNQSSSGHAYFTHNRLGEVLMEVRPNCLGELDIDTPSYLFNILELFEAKKSDVSYDYNCTNIEGAKACLVQVEYPAASGIKEKWHWLEIPVERSRSFVVDFIILESLPTLKDEIWEVISSVETMGVGATEPCRTPAAWL